MQERTVKIPQRKYLSAGIFTPCALFGFENQEKMQEKILERIARKTGIDNLVDVLSEQISGADLNSLLLEVFRRKTEKMRPEELLDAYRSNRFVQPSSVNALDFQAFILQALQATHSAGFEPIILSPVSPLGACSVVATAHQHKIISALRGTEVTADATNLMALESTVRRIHRHLPAETLHLSTTHRHVRAQEVPKMPGFSAHFQVLALTSAGRDTGSFQFEKESLLQHLQFYMTYFNEVLKQPVKFVRLKALDPAGEPNRVFEAIVSDIRTTHPEWPLDIHRSAASDQNYYEFLQFKIVINLPDGAEIEIADGGFTDWTRQLSRSRKERFLISGLGLELLQSVRA